MRALACELGGCKPRCWEGNWRLQTCKAQAPLETFLNSSVLVPDPARFSRRNPPGVDQSDHVHGVLGLGANIVPQTSLRASLLDF